MVKVNILIHPAPNAGMQRTFGILPGPHTFTRVPCVGEVINLGEDEQGHSADYMVTLVHHLPLQTGPLDAHAEIYAVRVNISATIQKASYVPDLSLAMAGAPLKL